MPVAYSPVLSWGIVLIVLILCWSMIVQPYIGWHEQRRADIEMLSKKAVRLQAMLATADAWQASADKFSRSDRAMLGALFQSSSYAKSQADLMAVVYASLHHHHLSVDTQTLLDGKSAAGFGEKIRISLRVHGSIADIVGFIHDIGHQPKLILLDNIYLARESGQSMLFQFKATGFRLQSGAEGV